MLRCVVSGARSRTVPIIAPLPVLRDEYRKLIFSPPPPLGAAPTKKNIMLR
jgi:hypothetical protein